MMAGITRLRPELRRRAGWRKKFDPHYFANDAAVKLENRFLSMAEE